MPDHSAVSGGSIANENRHQLALSLGCEFIMFRHQTCLKTFPKLETVIPEKGIFSPPLPIQNITVHQHIKGVGHPCRRATYFSWFNSPLNKCICAQSSISIITFRLPAGYKRPMETCACSGEQSPRF